MREINTRVYEASKAMEPLGKQQGGAQGHFLQREEKHQQAFARNAWNLKRSPQPKVRLCADIDSDPGCCCLDPKHVAFSLLKVTSANSSCLGSQTPQHKCKSSERQLAAVPGTK